MVKAQSKKKSNINFVLRALLSFFGVIFIAIGATLLDKGLVGLDPFTATNIGLSKLLGMGLGSTQLGFNAIIFVIVLVLDRKQMGLGTVFNMTLVGFGIQILSNVYDKYVTGLYIPTLIVDAFAGLAIFTLGTSMYMEANLGVAPYDAIAPIIVKRTHLKYQWVRSVQDLSFMVFGLCVHGDIGIMTIVIAFFAGPLISAWNIHFSGHIIKIINIISSPNLSSDKKSVSTASSATLSLHGLRKAYLETNMLNRNISSYSSNELLRLYTSNQHALKEATLQEHTLSRRLNIIKQAMKTNNN